MSLTNITLPGGSGLPAVGTVLSLWNLASPGVYNPVGNLSNLKINMKAVTADTTNMGTAWKQHITTLLDGGVVTADLYFIPASPGQDGATGIVGDDFVSAGALGWIFTQRAVRQYSLTFPDGTTWYFQATITDFPIDANVEKALTVSISFMITGQPSFA